MDRCRVKELLPFLIAFAEGKTVQVMTSPEYWEDLCSNPNWDKNPMHYRIKPEPRYVPYKTQEEAIENLKGKWLIRKSSNSLCIVAGICKTCVYIGNQSGTQSFENLLNDYTFEDGTRCGKLIS